MRSNLKTTLCLWFDQDAESAAQFYAKTFPDSRIVSKQKAPADYPNGKEGALLLVEFVVLGIACVGINGGPIFKHSEAFSFQIATENQAETDQLWHAIVDSGGAESQCGWCKDKWGISWQITPTALTQALQDKDPAARKRCFEAMMHMTKIDIAAIERARAGT